jgi:hypothetical protein
MLLELPECLHNTELFSSLIRTVNHELINRFRNFDKTWQSDEFLQLNSNGVAAILQSDEMDVATENTVYRVSLSSRISLFVFFLSSFSFSRSIISLISLLSSSFHSSN